VYDLALDRNSLESVQEQMVFLRTAFSEMPALAHYLESPVVPAANRAALVQQIAPNVDAVLAGLLTVLARRDRLRLLASIVAAFFAEDDRRHNRVHTVVTTAVAVDADQIAQIRQTLAKYLKVEPIIEHRVDSSILGGFIAQAGDTLIDGSVRSQLATVMERVVARGQDEV
jgi:F-type H+-transporting ATPase subunit delta